MENIEISKMYLFGSTTYLLELTHFCSLMVISIICHSCEDRNLLFFTYFYLY